MFYCECFSTEASLMGVKSVTVTVTVTLWVWCLSNKNKRMKTKDVGDSVLK